MFRSLFTPLFTRLASSLLVTVGTLLGAAGVTAAPLTMSISSTTTLTTLHVGDSFTINVILSGLAPAETLNLLSATAQYTGTALSSPTSVTVGPIVPGGAVNPDVSTLSGPNFAEADFQTFSGLPASQIVANGNFFSFKMTAVALGTGTISLSFLDALDGSAASPGSPGITAGRPLAFAVVPLGGGPGVPLPPALLSAILCIFALSLTSGHRRWALR